VEVRKQAQYQSTYIEMLKQLGIRSTYTDLLTVAQYQEYINWHANSSSVSAVHTLIC